MMRFEFPEQVFFRANRVTIVAVWGKEFVLAFGADGHRGNSAHVSQDGEITLWHSAGSLTQMIQALHHQRNSPPTSLGKIQDQRWITKKPTVLCCGLGAFFSGIRPTLRRLLRRQLGLALSRSVGSWRVSRAVPRLCAAHEAGAA
jgi:hypothetical protein